MGREVECRWRSLFCFLFLFFIGPFFVLRNAPTLRVKRNRGVLVKSFAHPVTDLFLLGPW